MMNPKDIVPGRLRRSIRHHNQHRAAKKQFAETLRNHFGDRLRRSPEGKVAPPEVVQTTALMHRDDLSYKSRRQVFLATGLSAMNAFLQAIGDAGLDLKEAQHALELGSGGGRLIRHLRMVEGLELVGSDLQVSAVSWCRENLPGIDFHVNELSPPLKFAKNESFDFVFAYSVFTHIPLELQLPWLEELARVLKKRGVAAVTTLSSSMARQMMNDEEYDEFVEAGHFTMGPEHPRVSASSAILGSWDVFMTNKFVRDLVPPTLEVVCFHDAPQAHLILRKI